MSNREKCVAILQAAKSAIDEATDDAYCESLFKQYEAEPDKGETIGLEETAQSQPDANTLIVLCELYGASVYYKKDELFKESLAVCETVLIVETGVTE